VVVFLWWCSCGGVFVVVWCSTGVVLEWCFCGPVLGVVVLWRQRGGDPSQVESGEPLSEHLKA